MTRREAKTKSPEIMIGVGTLAPREDNIQILASNLGEPSTGGASMRYVRDVSSAQGSKGPLCYSKHMTDTFPRAQICLCIPGLME